MASEDLLLNDPDMEQNDFTFLSREEAFSRAVKLSTVLIKSLRDIQTNHPKDVYYLFRTVNREIPIRVHSTMFIPTLQIMGTDSQISKWMPLAENYHLLGTYAQTELGHGTNVRGLETTATYDPKSQEFILHSPTLTSIKWWPGGLGKCSTHAVVMARLITRGKDQGIHPFIVQLRSLEDHMPLKGISVGDIGPKMGYDTSDNGFLQFTNVHIPRDQMLMRFSKVSPVWHILVYHHTLTKFCRLHQMAHIVMTLVLRN
jgi:acyl-CoA oxidase